MKTELKAKSARVLRDVLGLRPEDIAELFGVHAATVYRWLADTPTQLGPAGVENLDHLFAGQEFDDHRRFLAGIARCLAVRLDKVAVSEKAQDALAMPQLSKELRSIVAEIASVSRADEEWLADLFGAVGSQGPEGS